MKICEVKLPYDGNCSKNRMYIRKRNGVCISPETRMYKRLWEESIKLNTLRFCESEIKKVLVCAKVVRTDYRSDPVNLVDLLCDAVKCAIGVDDRKFAVKLDWVYGEEKVVFVEVYVYDHDGAIL